MGELLKDGSLLFADTCRHTAESSRAMSGTRLPPTAGRIGPSRSMTTVWMPSATLSPPSSTGGGAEDEEAERAVRGRSPRCTSKASPKGEAFEVPKERSRHDYLS